MASPHRAKLAVAFEWIGSGLLILSYTAMAIMLMQAVPIIAEVSAPIAVAMCLFLIPACVLVVMSAIWELVAERFGVKR